MRMLVLAAVSVLALASVPARAQALVEVDAERVNKDVSFPVFAADEAWTRLPDDIMLGQVAGLAIGADDHVWLVQRPQSLGATDTGLDRGEALSCCRTPPFVMRLDADGRMVDGWGGPDTAATIDGVNQWPLNTHGLFVDDDGNVWIGGNGAGDHAALQYSPTGEYLGQIGLREKTDGNFSESLLGLPADISALNGSVLLADGYANKRIIEFSEDHADHSFTFERFFGAGGLPPVAPVREGDFDQSHATSTGDGVPQPEGENFGDTVHCVVRAPEDTVYVCDRRNNRLQLFRETPGGVEFVRNIVIGEGTGGTRTATDVAVSPDGAYLYVADMMNGRNWILLRETHETLNWFGGNGRYPGEFIWLRSLDTDSAGNLYTSEVNTGRRVQRLVMTGLAE